MNMSDSEAEEEIFPTGYVYAIQDFDFLNLFYIGSTVHDPQQRWILHKRDAISVRMMHLKLYKHMNLRGHNRFRVRVWEMFEDVTRSELRQHEQSYIDFLEPPLNEIRAFRTAEQKREQQLAGSKAWHEDNRERRAELAAAWYENNRSKYFCDTCSYGCARPADLRKHAATRRHQRRIAEQEE
jgi:hypothetical protein